MSSGRASALRQRLERIVASVILLTALVCAAAFLTHDGGKSKEHWTFLDTASLAELGLVAHGAKGGSWGLEDHEPATGGRALANHRGEPGASPALLVAAQPTGRDVRARTRCKVVGPLVPDAGADTAAACGIVVRFLDEQNHWIVRADAGERALEAAAVVRGQERVIKRAAVPRAIEPGRWIDLAVEVRGDVVRASLDGEPALVAEAPTIPAASGAVGLWAPSGTAVYFDHFAIETLSTAPRALEILPILGKRPG
jgi:hypothetical protein